MKNLLIILISFLPLSTGLYSQQLDITFFAEIDPYYKEFNDKNGLKEKKVSIGFSSDGSVAALPDNLGMKWDISYVKGTNYIVKGTKNGKVLISKKYIIMNDSLEVQNLITNKSTTYIFEKNYKVIRSEEFSVERKRNHLIARNSKNILLEYNKNELTSYVRGWKQNKIDYKVNRGKNYVYLWKTGPEDSWDAMYENSNVVYTKYEFSKDLRINLMNYLILKDFDSVISKILFRDLFI